jgi:large subunit ribosomal protein L31
MKKAIHPAYHEISVKQTNGKTIKMYSSVKKDMVLSSDNLNHPAYTGNTAVEAKGQRAEGFKKKFSGFNF